MEVDSEELLHGKRVRIVKLQETTGWFVNPEYLSVRKAGITGVVSDHVPGHGGDVWWIEHDNSTVVGAYGLEEFEVIT